MFGKPGPHARAAVAAKTTTSIKVTRRVVPRSAFRLPSLFFNFNFHLCFLVRPKPADLPLFPRAQDQFPRAEQNIAETLQRSLLPQQLPLLGRLSLAARYLPGAAGTQAGGDWYDVV